MPNSVTFDLFARDQASGAFLKVGRAAQVAGRNVDDLGRRAGGLSGHFAAISRIGPRSFGLIATGAKAAGLGLAGAAVSGAAFGLKTAASMETAKIGFTTMLGSAQKAGAFLKDLQKFAAATPFEFPELQTAASSLISVGVKADKVIPIMKTLGDVTAGMGTGSEGIKRATVALQQMSAAGKITGEDLNQLRDAGIPVFDLLSAATGKTKAEVVKLAQAGKLGKKELDQMFAALESGKGLERFNGLMEQQSQSLSGLFSTLKDNISMTLANLVTPAIPAIKAGLNAFSDLVAAVAPKVQKSLGDVIGAIKAGVRGEIPAEGGVFRWVALASQTLKDFAGWVKVTAIPAIVAGFADVKTKIEDSLPSIDLSGLAKTFTEQASKWGGAIIAGVKTGLATGDWSGLGSTVGSGILAAISSAADLAQKVAGAVGDLLGKVDWFDIGKAVGKTAIPFLVGFVNTLTDGLFKVAKEHPFDTALFIVSFLGIGKVGGIIAKVLEKIPFLRVFAPLFRGIASITKPVNDAIGKVVGSTLRAFGRGFIEGFRIIFPGIGKNFLAHLRNLPTYIGVVALELVEKARAMMARLAKAILDGGVGPVGRAIGKTIANMLKPFASAGGWLIRRGTEFVSGLLRGITSMLGTVARAVGRLILTITRPFVQAGGFLLRRGVEFVGGLVRGVLSGLGSAARAAGRLISAVTAPFRAAGRWLINAGLDVVGGLFSGMRSAMRVVGRILSDIKDSIVGGLKRLFNISSPSKVMAGIGGHLITGLIKGMLTQSGALARTVKNIGGTVAGIFGGVGDLAFGGGSTASGAMQKLVQGYASMLYGWTGSQWTALRALLMGESGFNPNAQNPTSSAYGMFQFLDSTWGFVNAQKTSNPAGQTLAGLRYIAQVYGNPVNAFSAWLNRRPHWYGAGMPPTMFNQPTLIGVGERGPEMVSVTPQRMLQPGRSGGGNTYNISLTVGPGANPREVGRVLVEHIKAYERGSGTAWRTA